MVAKAPARALPEVIPQRVDDPNIQRALDAYLSPLKAVVLFCQRRVLVTVDFTTGAALTDGYPLSVRVDADPIGLSVIKVVDVLNPEVTRYDPVCATAWTAGGGLISIKYFSGLSVSTRYLITLEVISA